MNYSYYILPPAVQEFNEARNWYRKQNVSGLSNRFAQSVKKAINRIIANPYAFAVRYNGVRIAHTENFPYAVHFYIADNNVVITAIIFHGRDPQITNNRLG